MIYASGCFEKALGNVDQFTSIKEKIHHIFLELSASGLHDYQLNTNPLLKGKRESIEKKALVLDKKSDNSQQDLDHLMDEVLIILNEIRLFEGRKPYPD